MIPGRGELHEARRLSRQGPLAPARCAIGCAPPLRAAAADRGSGGLMALAGAFAHRASRARPHDKADASRASRARARGLATTGPRFAADGMAARARVSSRVRARCVRARTRAARVGFRLRTSARGRAFGALRARIARARENHDEEHATAVTNRACRSRPCRDLRGGGGRLHLRGGGDGCRRAAVGASSPQAGRPGRGSPAAGGLA